MYTHTCIYTHHTHPHNTHTCTHTTHYMQTHVHINNTLHAHTTPTQHAHTHTTRTQHTLHGPVNQLAEVIFVRFSTVKLLLLLSPYFTVWKKVTMCIPHWRSEELCSTSLEIEPLYILFDSAWEISLFSLIHSIMYTNVDPSTVILDYN